MRKLGENVVKSVAKNFVVMFIILMIVALSTPQVKAMVSNTIGFNKVVCNRTPQGVLINFF